jgi:DNA repair exonuclease SbcCD ATPase subunit
MTLDITQLQKRIALKFPDVEQVDDSILRFTKGLEGTPYAVYYLDIAQDFPSSQKMLAKYQDRVIGSHYFEGRKSLQWSNYLYFITSHNRLMSDELVGAKDLIEQDRSYARKFVIPEEDLELVLTPPVIAPAEATPHAGILSTWSKILVATDLDRVILSDDDLPTRLKLIEASPTETKLRLKRPRLDKVANNQPFIRSLKLERFRDFPIQHDFDFGNVNLIFGINGSGKTSLLEAIELFYCGRHKRNPNKHPSYSLAIVFADGNSETATANRERQVFRDRNLAWYGQLEVKTNKLYQSFAQFNFLDTDAAVDLTDSTSRIEDDLSRLLVGSEASKVWRNIERVTDEITKKLKGLNPLKAQIKDELRSLGKLLSEAGGVRQESDSISIRLKAMVDRVGWRETQDDKEEFAAGLVESLAELVSIAQQATKIEWTSSPVSMEGLATYCCDAKFAIDKGEADLCQLELLQKEQQKIENLINRGRQATDLEKQVRRFIDAGLLSRVEELNKLQDKVATLSGWLAGLDAKSLDVVSTTNLEVSVADYQESLIAKRSAAEISLTNSKNEYNKFSELRDQSLNLTQQLREIAAKILQGNPKPDECPLCHTQFGSGELEKHINLGIDEHLEALGQTLLTQLREQEAVLRDILTIEAAFGLLIKFCERVGLGVDMTVYSVLTKMKNTNRTLAELQNQLDVLNNEIQSLESRGLSIEKLEGITDQLRELGYPINVHSEEDVNRLLLAVDEKALSNTLDNNRKNSNELRRVLAKSLGSTDPDGKDLEGKLSQLKERFTKTKTIQEKLGHFSALFPWPVGKPLVKLVVEANSIRKVAAELQTVLGKEKQAKDSYAESANRKEKLEKQLAKLLPQISRFSKAQSVLSALQKDHSLNSAMEAALQENRIAIETIFSQIHSPAEFSGLGSTWSILIRKMDGKEAELTEISAGQRAAFALSIFLAQNAKLKVAPPVVLIDDPIAHVDDMNALSFLDYLREVALKGQRQIFFATANDKLAALFERKFDFFGPDKFRRFNLIRNA